ncbi:nitroreductase family protein [Salinicoccus sp. HZC-1]|uniref:nitroreductase family protein n=1 Tax=Salinicoccus sp. HZC-1 TaxID=3385497 RepID=UPI00398BAADA
MNVHKAIENRRKITSFSSQKIDPEKLDRIVKSGYMAPAGNNLPSREFVVITDTEVLKEMSEATPFMKWLAGSQAGIVVTGRPDVSKYWLQDALIASGFLRLASTEEDLGAAFGAIYHSEDEVEPEKRESHVRKLADIPIDRRIVAVVGLGQVDENPKPKDHLPFEEMVHYVKFKDS